MEEGFTTDHVDPHDALEELERRIEKLTTKIENCRKFILASRAAVAVGGLLLLAVTVGAIRSDPMIVAVGIISTIGGLVLIGSNRSTAKEASEQLVYLNARRTAAIDRIDPRVVNDRDGTEIPQRTQR